MAPVARRAAAAALAAALSLRGSAAAAPAEGTCPSGSLPSAAGACAPLHRETALLQVESVRLAAARDGVLQMQDAGICCFWPIGTGGCDGCQSSAAAGSWCASGEGYCGGCGGTWCPGAGTPTAPATAPAQGPDPTPAPAPAAEDPAPDTPAPTPEPAADTPSPEPAADTPTPEPGTDAPTPEPATDAPTPEPATDAPTPEPATDVPTPEPATDAPTPEPATDAPTPEPATDAPTPEPATDAPTPEPATDTSTQAPTAPAVPNLLWADEFDGSGVDRSKWGFDIGDGGWGNQEREYYTDRNALVQGGTLKLVAKCEQFHGSSFTSAKLKSTAAWGPGIRVEVRARLPTGRGSWPAIWMLPQTNTYGPWPKSGEIDIMEAVGCEHSKVHGTVHTGKYNHVLGTQKTMSVGAEVSGWRTYAIEWEERQIRWYVDGSLYFTFAPSSYEPAKWPFDQKFYLILNVAVGGSWGGYCTPGGPSCRDSGQFGTDQVMEVDYARVSALR